MRDYADLITWVVVADGEKALVFRNADTDAAPLLQVVSEAEIENPPTREQGVSRAGRSRDHGGGGKQRSALEETDWHRLEKVRFAKDFTARLNNAALNDSFDRIAIFAPPHVLGEMRVAFHPELKKRIIAESASDITRHSIEDIEDRVAKILAPKPPPSV
ncbi:MAG TPA: host attachment family protein [Parvularculaceae bacterium]|nr:host attachment family protein [Parvularculaceae bacterium]